MKTLLLQVSGNRWGKDETGKRKYAHLPLLRLAFLLFFNLSFALSQSHAQEFSAFKLDIGLGYAFGGNAKFEDGLEQTGRAGIAFYLEPRYGINDQITLGFRLVGSDILGEGTLKQNGMDADDIFSSISISGIRSCFATMDYYFSTNTFRPYAGLGVGLYSGESVLLTVGSTSLSAESKKQSGFGIMPRVGANIGHFKMILSYNLPFKKKLPKYLSFTLGVEFGGGRK